jgi:endonuclease/exonuclease/phosphatase family metal-dependent hydrolase
MRFLTFNLWHGLTPSTPVAFEALEPVERRELREKMQLEVLSRVQPDVSFFQEVNPVGERGPKLCSALSSNAVSQLDLVGIKLFGVGIPLNLNSGLVTSVAKRWPLKRLEAISLSRPGVNLVHRWASWQLREERFALFAETMLPKWGKVLLVNTHIHHGVEATRELMEKLEAVAKEMELPEAMVSELRDRFNRGNERRKQELEILMAKIDELGQRYAAVIVGGDFNSVPESGAAEFMRASGFRDVWSEGAPGVPGFTFDSATNVANHLLQLNFPLTLVVEDLSFSAKIKETLMAMGRAQERRPRRIDYLWLKTRGLDVSVKHTELVGLPDSEGLAPSDHFGVCADIEVD